MLTAKVTGKSMFKELLQDAVERSDANGALLMGFDGIAVDRFVPGESDPTRIDAVGIEYGIIVKSIREAARMLEAGGTSEVTIRTERMTSVIRLLTEEYFAAITLNADGNVGKARYSLRRISADLIDGLS